MKINKEASEKAFGKVDLDYFVQSGIENAANEEELDAEVKIFQNALDFSNIKIRDCIVPRTEIVAVDVTASLEELKSLFVESGISKIIVYDGNIDNVIGYIHSSEMFRNPADWRNNVKEVPIVPETMAAHKLMKLLCSRKRRLPLLWTNSAAHPASFLWRIWWKRYSEISRTSTIIPLISVNRSVRMNMSCPRVLK